MLNFLFLLKTALRVHRGISEHEHAGQETVQVTVPNTDFGELYLVPYFNVMHEENPTDKKDDESMELRQAKQVDV